MNEKQIRQLKPMLSAYLKRFDDCFPRKDTRAHLQLPFRNSRRQYLGIGVPGAR